MILHNYIQHNHLNTESHHRNFSPIKNSMLSFNNDYVT